LPSDYLEAGRAPRLTEAAQVIRSCKSFGMVAFALSKSKAPDQDSVPVFPEVKHKGQLDGLGGRAESDDVRVFEEHRAVALNPLTDWLSWLTASSGLGRSAGLFLSLQSFG
jgi:hypothetical protein